MEIINLANAAVESRTPGAILKGYAPLMSTADTSAALGVTQAVVRDLCRRKKLPSVKIGRRVYIVRDKLEEQIIHDMNEI